MQQNGHLRETGRKYVFRLPILWLILHHPNKLLYLYRQIHSLINWKLLRIDNKNILIHLLYKGDYRLYFPPIHCVFVYRSLSIPVFLMMWWESPILNLVLMLLKLWKKTIPAKDKIIQPISSWCTLGPNVYSAEGTALCKVLGQLVIASTIFQSCLHYGQKYFQYIHWLLTYWPNLPIFSFPFRCRRLDFAAIF